MIIANCDRLNWLSCKSSRRSSSLADLFGPILNSRRRDGARQTDRNQHTIPTPTKIKNALAIRINSTEDAGWLLQHRFGGASVRSLRNASP